MKRRNCTKKIFEKGLLGILCVATLFSLVACKNKEEEEKCSSIVLQETDYKLVENGASEYRIVVSQETQYNETVAAEELQYFLFLATGAELPIVTDEHIKTDAAVISIGETKIAEAFSVDIKNEELGTSGYLIKTLGKSIVILSEFGGSGEGCIYGVYDFLNDAVDFQAYASDELAYSHKDTVPVYAYDLIVRPSFDIRAITYYDLLTDSTYRTRMRLLNQYNNELWGLFGHTQVGVLLPATRYFGEHPEWYNSTGTQICWTAGRDAELAVAENLYDIIIADPTASYFMLGQEDNSDFCSCSKCLAALEEYGYTQSGLQVAFVNNVIELVEDWLADSAPDREIKYVMFAYAGTLEAPVKRSGNSWMAYSDNVIPHEKMYIYFTPIQTDFSKPLEAEENATVYEALQGWKTLVDDRMIVYTYDTNFSNFFINFNNFGVAKTHFQTYVDCGIDYMYLQSAVTTNMATLQEMRIFVESRLMWDLSLEYDELVNEFMAAYYKQAGSAMRKYYDLTRQRYANYEWLNNANYGSIYANIGTSGFWTEPVVSALATCLDEALEAIEPIKGEDPDLYEKVKGRIKRQELTVLFLKLKYYTSYYSQSEIEQMKEDFLYYSSRYNIYEYYEGSGSLDTLFN